MRNGSRAFHRVIHQTAGSGRIPGCLFCSTISGSLMCLSSQIDAEISSPFIREPVDCPKKVNTCKLKFWGADAPLQLTD